MDNTYLDNNIKSSCNGCGVCALVCPMKCIKMVTDEEGFLYPEIDKEKCINCGKCKNYCGNFNSKKDADERAYIAINKSSDELKMASSGGMFYLLAKYTIEKNGVVCGVTYNEDLEVVHEFADNLEDCKKFCGSKYVRSYLQDSYKKAKEYLENGRYVLFTGTACQLSGLKKYLSKDYDNLILCDILCHANPSPKVFKQYISNIEKNENKKVKDVLFRDKNTGWKNQVPTIVFEDGTIKTENSYFNAFVREMINRPSCYSRQFATQRRITDFTIADLWGIEKVDATVDTTNGVSLLTVNSLKGRTIFNEINNQMNFKETDYNLVASYNHYHNVLQHKNRDSFFKGIASGTINENNIISYMNRYTNGTIIKKGLRKIKRVVKKIIKK